MAILGPVIGYFAIRFLIMGFPHKDSFIDSPPQKRRTSRKNLNRTKSFLGLPQSSQLLCQKEISSYRLV